MPSNPTVTQVPKALDAVYDQDHVDRRLRHILAEMYMVFSDIDFLNGQRPMRLSSGSFSAYDTALGDLKTAVSDAIAAAQTISDL